MKVYIIAGEPSGDRLGGALMAGLKELAPDVTFEGIGGPEMSAQGLRSQFPMEELSVVGIVEVLPKYFHLKRRIREAAEAVLADPPDVVITIDSPDFSLRVLKIVRAARPDQRTVHYVAPSVWAWRPKRAEKMAPLVDQVLALLPFEPPYMEAAGMRCDFVGHPVTTETQASEAEAAAYRADLGLSDDQLLILALPGSRRGEVKRHSPVFGEALERVLKVHSDAQIVVPTVSAIEADVRERLKDWPGAPVLIPGNDAVSKRAAFRAADVALAASGTVSLELAAVETPMVIAYDLAPATRMLVQRAMLIDTFTLVNLVSETRAVPEYIVDDCKPEPIATGLLDLIEHPDRQRDAMRVTMDRLGRGAEPPGRRAARAVLDGLAQG